MKKYLVIITAIVMLMAGCSALNVQPSHNAGADQIVDQLVEMHKEYVKAITKFKLTSEDLVDIALFEVGFVRESMGGDLQNMKGEALAILDKYEEIVLSCEGQEMDDYKKGQIAGLRWRFLYLVGRQAVEELGPGILNIFRIVLTK